MNSTRRIFVIGPTASGKSDWAVRIAQKTDGEIISADARQCYKGMEIGSAAPESEWLRLIPHFNVSCLEPSTPDDAAAFSRRAENWIHDIRQRGKIPVIAGGSTLYLQALIHPFDDVPSSNPEHVKQLRKRADEEGLDALYNDLLRVDPEYANKMDGMNRQRILRALDVWMQTGKPFSSFHQSITPSPHPGDLWLGLLWTRDELLERIETRTRELFSDAFEEEVRRLWHWPNLVDSTVGFKQMAQALRGEISRVEAIERTIIATRQYAKRQMTWFRRWPFIQWFHPEKEQDKLVELAVNQVAANPKNPYI